MLLGMSDVTRILAQIQSGEPQAAEQLLPLVYDELRKLAAARLASERPGQTLQATALVHEAYLRLVASGGREPPETPVSLESGVGQGVQVPTSDPRSPTPGFSSRTHFFAAAAQAMRRILVDQARRKLADKRGGQGQRFELADADGAYVTDPDTLLSIDESLERLAADDPSSAEVARLRLFAGMSVEEAGSALGLSRATAFREWSFARAWLAAALSDGKKSGIA
jgi:DNA-directed RNA polymerase specialized sigma24 family protein